MPGHEDASLPEEEQQLAALLAGPSLGNVAAAVKCHCSCHPRPADVKLHQGGVTCPCQMSQEEARAARQRSLDKMREMGEKFKKAYEPVRLEQERQVAALCEDLDVTVLSWGGMAPFVITGVVDGRFFFLRERHDVYRVEISPDDSPLHDIWRDYERGGVTVVDGTVEDLLSADGRFSPAAALEVAVRAVRVFLRRRQCLHDAPAGSWFCPSCGTYLGQQIYQVS